MKKRGYIFGAVALAMTLSGCSSSYFASAGYGNDDLYAVHDKAAIARRQQAQAEAQKAEAEARKAEWEARLAEAEANAVQRRYYEATAAENPYEEVLAETYESAYARRLRGFESPTYRMPSSYYDFRYGNSFNYVSAYDPAFYNVMVMGDQVWVEPKYITAMFGSWGRPSIYVDPWYYGWNYRHYHGWGFSFGSWGWSFGWHDPWYYPAGTGVGATPAGVIPDLPIGAAGIVPTDPMPRTSCTGPIPILRRRAGVTTAATGGRAATLPDRADRTTAAATATAISACAIRRAAAGAPTEP